MNEMIMIWLIILILAIVIELISLGLTTIWFAGGALAAVAVAALGAPLWLQILIFLIVSIALLAFTRPVAVKYFNKERVRTNVESLVGRQAIVISEIDNLQGTGQVTVGGQEWSARSSVEGRLIAPGTIVRITAINGVKLIVEEDPDMKGAEPAQRAMSEAELDPRYVEKLDENGRMSKN
jgi:membrane protein implicated in regulation of membrane protease activity